MFISLKMVKMIAYLLADGNDLVESEKTDNTD